MNIKEMSDEQLVELTDLDINKAVAKKLDLKWHLSPCATRNSWEYSDNYGNNEIDSVDLPDYCNNPSASEPIILKEKINRVWEMVFKTWRAEGLLRKEDEFPVVVIDKNNPTRAAMLVFLKT
jgi:hypothetical protein